MAISKSGLTKEERESYLREKGFEPVRQARGSHSMWEHPALKKLALQHKIECPANLMTTADAVSWQRPLCNDPAVGTWQKIQKHADWCEKTVDDLKSASQTAEFKKFYVRECRKAFNEVAEWKRSVKHWIKADLSVEEAPKAPESYHKLVTMTATKKAF